MAKYKNLNSSKTQNYKSDQDQIWGPTTDQQLHFVGGLTLPRSNPIWLPATILKNGYDVTTLPTIVRLLRNLAGRCKMTCRWLYIEKSKPEIELEYGGRHFSETGSSLISAVDWDISSKSGMRRDFYHLKQILSLNPYPEVDYRLYGRHLKNRYDVITPPTIILLLRNLAGFGRINQVQYGGRLFAETGSSFISAVDWGISSKFGRQINLHLLKQMPSLNLSPQVHFRLYSRHFQNWIWRHNSAADRRICTKLGRQM